MISLMENFGNIFLYNFSCLIIILFDRFGRGEYSSVYSLIQGNYVNWDNLWYTFKLFLFSFHLFIIFNSMIAFDNPSPNLRKVTFEERYEQLLDSISLHHPFMISYN